uniref:Uncharacterized protein n=1 Tax=viral metagenome TaxID=1070528 RepID=A0A6C0BR76_9ZZZZ
MSSELDIIEVTDLSSEGAASGKIDFGGGAELLMNTRKQSSDSVDKLPKTNDISSLEDDLNELTSNIQIPTLNFSEPLPSTPIINPPQSPGPPPLTDTDSNIGKATSNSETDNIFKPVVSLDIEQSTKKVQQTPEEKQRDKLIALRKLEDLESKGVKLSKHYTMESSISEMNGEYEVHISNKERSNSIKFQGKMLMMAITGLEFLNSKFDPFDVKLDGWGEQLNENIDDYDEIFAELHEKYKQKAKMAPEVKLLFQLAGSGIMVHMTNTMFKSAMPGIDDIMKQHPDLAKQFTSAAVNSMGSNNPGFGNFMNDITGNSPPPPSMNVKPTKSTRDRDPPTKSYQTNTDGVDISDPYSSYNTDEVSTTNVSRVMKGPSDIDDILSGLKNKSPQPENNGSTVSLQDLADMNNASVPTRRKRKTKSDKSVSLPV